LNTLLQIHTEGKTMSNKITAADLRIGNILNYDTAEGDTLPTRIEWQDLKWISEDEVGFNLVHSPTTLRAVHLKQFGFSDGDYKDGYIGKDFKSGGMILDFVLSKPYTKGEWNTTYTLNLEGHRFIKIEFVHQLQNVFFELTNQELTKNDYEQ